MTAGLRDLGIKRLRDLGTMGLNVYLRKSFKGCKGY